MQGNARTPRSGRGSGYALVQKAVHPLATIAQPFDDARLLSRPRGSRVRAQYFYAILDGVVVRVASVTSYDADGRMLARDRGVNGSGIYRGR